MSFKALENLNGKVAIITGGGHIARATAKKLSLLGANIILLVRRDLEYTQSYLDSLGIGHLALYTDVLDTQSIRQAISKIKEKYNKCDILVNTAGRSRTITVKNVHELTDEIFDEIIKTNIRGTFAVIRELHDMLHNSGDGLIVNISSTSGLRGGPSCLAYGASKAAVDLMTKTLGKALGPTIRVVAIAPGHLINPTSGALQNIQAVKNKMEQSPLSRVVHADDIASAVCSFAKDIRFATGTTLVIDGGSSI